jgi:Fuseless
MDLESTLRKCTTLLAIVHVHGSLTLPLLTSCCVVVCYGRPIAVTAVSSYYSLRLPAGEKPPKISNAIIVVDIFFSFIVIPFFVVWFWRGSWLVLDFYLWKFSPENSAVWASVGWSTLIALIFLFVSSETVFTRIKLDTSLLGPLGRLRTYIAAWGIVNYWRAVWYIWDESAGTSQWSCWVCHLVPMAILITMGCMSCLLAPASTMGVDVVPHPDCADEPLFAYLPVPAEDLALFGIACNPQVLSEENMTQEALAYKKSFVQMSMLEFSQMLDVDDYIQQQDDIKKQKAASTGGSSVELSRIETGSTALNQLDEDTANGSKADTPKKAVDDEVEAVDDVDHHAPQPVDVEAAANEDAALANFAASLTALSHDADAAAEEAEMAAAWADMEAKMGTKVASKEALSASSAWASGGTGKRASYSSVRTPGEVAEHRSSYLDLQRPDLDRRVSHRASEQHRSSVRGSLQGDLRTSSAGTRSSVRRSSDLFRSR